MLLVLTVAIATMLNNVHISKSKCNTYRGFVTLHRGYKDNDIDSMSLTAPKTNSETFNTSFELVNYARHPKVSVDIAA